MLSIYRPYHLEIPHRHHIGIMQDEGMVGYERLGFAVYPISRLEQASHEYGTYQNDPVRFIAPCRWRVLRSEYSNHRASENRIQRFEKSDIGISARISDILLLDYLSETRHASLLTHTAISYLSS